MTDKPTTVERADRSPTSARERPAPPLRQDGIFQGEDDLTQLDARRRALGYTHADVDRLAGWPSGTSRNVFSRARGPNYGQLQALRRALGVRCLHATSNATLITVCHTPDCTTLCPSTGLPIVVNIYADHTQQAST